LDRYNEAIERNLAREDQLNALRLQETLRRGAEDRQFGRQKELIQLGQTYQTSEREAGQGFRTGEREAGQGFQEVMVEAGQEFRTGEREAGQAFRTTEREASERAALERMKKGSEYNVEEIRARYAGMAELDKTQLPASKGFINLYKKDPITGQAIKVGPIDEGLAQVLVSEILKNPEALKEWKALKASFSGITNTDVKGLIADHWHLVEHLVYGRQPVTEEIVDPNAAPDLTGAGQTSKERRKAQKDAVKQIGIYDHIFTGGTR